jgi:hypothetical protein
MGDTSSPRSPRSPEEEEPQYRPRHLAQSVVPVALPMALFCSLMFAFPQVLSQFVNEVSLWVLCQLGPLPRRSDRSRPLQLECTRLGASDCDSEAVNKAAVRTNTLYLGLEVSIEPTSTAPAAGVPRGTLVILMHQDARHRVRLTHTHT